MKRSEQREHIFKIIFGVEFFPPEDLPGQIDMYLEANGVDEAGDAEYIRQKAMNAALQVKSLDEEIGRYSKGWKTSRMNKADLSILRLAVYEMKEDPDVPVSVAINEAVELAKKYGGDDSPSFVNGVLAKIAKGLE